VSEIVEVGVRVPNVVEVDLAGVGSGGELAEARGAEARS
jgi:hypothetical protein